MTANLMGFLDYDAELSLHNERLRGATGVGPADCVLDIGCGAGQTTRDAARAALAEHETERGVWFDSRAWIVTARRGGA